MSPEVRRRRRGRTWRRVRRWAGERPRTSIAIAAGGLVVLLGLWCGWRTWTIQHDLDQVARNAQILRAALERGDVHGARVALAHFRTAADRAADHTGGPTWGALEHLPVLGDDARGVATASSVLSDIGDRALPPVVGAAGRVTGAGFRPHDHRFPLARIAAMRAPALHSEHALAADADRLRGVDSSGFIGPFRSRFDQLRSLVQSGKDVLGSAYRAARMMPDMLGAHGPRNYVLVLENNAELRSLGGLAGSLSLVHADHGVVHIVSQDDMANLARSPRIRLTPDERELFGNLLRITGVNATMTPDAQRAAELVRLRWVADHGGRVDGVFFVDPVAVSYLLQGLGNVAVPGYPPVSSLDVVQYVENLIYIETTNRQVQSDYQNAVARAVFNAFADGRGDPVTAIRGLARAVAEGRVRMHSFVPADQAGIARTAIAGAMSTRATAHPQAGVYLNDSTESKMSFYLQSSVDVASRSCGGGFQEGVGTLSLTNDAPPNLAKLPVSVTGADDPSRDIRRGQQFVVVYLTSPVGGTITGLSIDGRKLDSPAIVDFRGRKVATVGVRLDPHSTHTVQWLMRSGVRQTASWQVSVTPTAQAGTGSETVPSDC